MSALSHSGTAWSRLCARTRGAVLIMAGVALLGGCTDVPDDPEGRGNIRAVHAMPTLGEVGFFIEERGLAEATYQTVTPYSTYDSLQYDFNFDYTSGVTGDRTRLVSTSLNVQPDTNHTLLLTGTPAAPEVIVVDQAIAEFDEGATSLLVWFANLSSAASIDIYVGAPGFDPAATQPLTSGLTARTVTETQSFEAGEVELVATVAGDVSQLLIRTGPVTLSSRDVVMIGLLDSANVVAGDYIFVLGGETNSGRIVDDSAPTSVRLFHGINGATAVDLYVNEETTTPVIGDLEFGGISLPVVIPEADDIAEVTYNVTAAGNVGAPVASSNLVFGDGSTNLLAVVIEPSGDEPTVLQIPGNRSPVFDAALVGVYNTAQTIDRLNLYFVPSDSTFEDTSPSARNISPSLDAGQYRLAPDTYQIILTNAEDDTVVFGPAPLEIEAGQVQQIMIVETADPNVLETTVFSLIND